MPFAARPSISFTRRAAGCSSVLTSLAIVPLNKYSQEFSPIEKHFDEFPKPSLQSGPDGNFALLLRFALKRKMRC
jgi:hypothetical protein